MESNKYIKLADAKFSRVPPETPTSTSSISPSYRMDNLIDTSPFSSSSTSRYSTKKNYSIDFFDFSYLNWARIGFIILLLAFLGINIFSYLASATELSLDFLSIFGKTASDTAKQTINTTATGTKTALDILANTSTNTLDQLDNSFDRSNKMNNNIPKPDDTGSLIQRGKRAIKPGYCYIGEDRGFRSCIKVGTADTCMSGEIYPTKDICINPTLRE